jgi:chitodextrinase
MSTPHSRHIKTSLNQQFHKLSYRSRVRLSLFAALALLVGVGFGASALMGNPVHAQTSGTNHAHNPVLANSAKGWGMLTGGSGSRVAISGDGSAHYAYKTNVSGSKAGIYTPQQKVSSGQQWTFAVDAKGSGKAYVVADWYGSGGHSDYLGEDKASSVALNPHSWTKVSGSFKAPSGTVNTHVGIYLKGGSGAWYVTNASYTNGAGGSSSGESGGQASACEKPRTDNGIDTETVTIPAKATYVIWSRMRGSDANEKSILMQVDGNHCYNVGGKSLPSNHWTWVNYQNGDTSNVIKLQLSKGTHHVKYYGTHPGTLVDRTIISSNQDCVPKGNGDSCASGDATPPSVSLSSPTKNATVKGKVTVAASASDDKSGVKNVAFYIDGQKVSTDSSNPYSYSWNTKAATNGHHTVKAQATDKAGNIGSSQTVTVKVNNKQAGCSAAPSKPKDLNVSQQGRTSVSLSWQASKAAAHCTLSGYNVYRDGGKVATVHSGTTYKDSDLDPSSSYTYQVSAIDSNNHESAKSKSVHAKTQGDSQAPSAPSHVKTTAVTANQVTLQWSESQDNVGVQKYQIFRDGQEIGTSQTTSYSDRDLQPSTSYKYTVKAVDGSGNVSSASSALNVKTLKGDSHNKGDGNDDGHVNRKDLRVLLVVIFRPLHHQQKGDYNGDGQSNIYDLSILLSHWQRSYHHGFFSFFNFF